MIKSEKPGTLCKSPVPCRLPEAQPARDDHLKNCPFHDLLRIRRFIHCTGKFLVESARGAFVGVVLLRPEQLIAVDTGAVCQNCGSGILP